MWSPENIQISIWRHSSKTPLHSTSHNLAKFDNVWLTLLRTEIMQQIWELDYQMAADWPWKIRWIAILFIATTSTKLFFILMITPHQLSLNNIEIWNTIFIPKINRLNQSFGLAGYFLLFTVWYSIFWNKGTMTFFCKFSLSMT